MEGLYEEYLKFLESLGQTLEQLTELAMEKADAVRKDDLVRLNACMNREQALSLALRSMDRKRETLLKQMGLEDVTLSGLAGRYPPALQARAREVAGRTQDQYRIYASAAEVAQTTLECNLHQIEKILAEQSGGDTTFTDIRV